MNVCMPLNKETKQNLSVLFALLSIRKYHLAKLRMRHEETFFICLFGWLVIHIG